jgi:predicted dehydrogenase
MWILNLEFANDVIGRVTVSSGCQRPYNIDLKVWGTKGTLEGDNTSPEAKMSLRQVDRHRWMDVPKSRMAKALAGEMAHFIDCILNDKTPLIDGVDGAKTVATAWAAIESSANGGKPVEVRNDF